MPSDEMVEKACAAYWEHYREAWRPSGTLPAKYDVPFADLPPNTKHLTAKAMEAALDAAEAETKPVAWMRRWAADKIDVMALKKPDRPRGWHLYATTEAKLLADGVPLYASPRPEAVGAVKAERERCAWIADNFDYNSVECDHYNLMPLGYKICEGIAAAIMAGEEDKG